jgi:hypothetical protein
MWFGNTYLSRRNAVDMPPPKPLMLIRQCNMYLRASGVEMTAVGVEQAKELYWQHRNWRHQNGRTPRWAYARMKSARMEFARMDVHLDGVHQTGRTRNWPTSMHSLAASSLLQGLEHLTRCSRPLVTMSPMKSCRHLDWLRNRAVGGAPKPSSV